MDLQATEMNPIPRGAVQGMITTSDGVRLRYARWRATARKNLGTVCLLQGRGESIEKYYETVDDLRARGFAVATLDWRGQGGSERRLRDPRKGHVYNFNEYERDLEAFMQQVALPDCPPPHYALAHSTGGLICLRAIRSARVRFTRLVLAAPLIGLGPGPLSQKNTARLATLLTAIGLGEIQLPARFSKTIDQMVFEGNELTSDKARFDRNYDIAKQVPSIQVGAPTVAWLYAACKAMREVTDPDFGPSVRVPILIVAAANDRVVSNRAIELLAGELRAGAHLMLRGAEHELLMEKNTIRQQFFAAFDAFVPGSGARL
jgi:lysophospholipase